MKIICFIIGLAISLVCFSCKDEMGAFEPCNEYEKGSVAFGLLDGARIQDFFAFANQYHLGVDLIFVKEYESGLPADSIDYVINYLKSKSYITLHGWTPSKGNVLLNNQTSRLTLAVPFGK